MSFDWSEYLKLARQLAVLDGSALDQEARLRSAISRAYYAAFCRSRNYLRDTQKRSVPGGAKAHAYVREQFLNSSVETRKEVGENLERLREARNKADYDDNVPGLPSLARTALEWAKEAIASLASL